MNFSALRLAVFIIAAFSFSPSALADDPAPPAYSDDQFDAPAEDNSVVGINKATSEEALTGSSVLLEENSSTVTTEDDGIEGEPVVETPQSEPVEGAPPAGGSTAQPVVRGDNPGGGQRSQTTLPSVTDNGALSYAYPIAVPAFKGIEPKLALSYSSARKTKVGGDYQGWLGYGWGLSGIPVIERAGYQLGVPTYGTDDTFLLNGQPLVRCSDPAVSGGASCDTDADSNWVSETENYLKIRYNGTANTWEVTATDGTKTVFESVGSRAGASSVQIAFDQNNEVRSKYRWLATSVVDPSGNTVQYSYSCIDLPVCYPKEITYNNRKILFYYEARPDYLTTANGHSIATTTQRIKTILVQTSGDNTRGYRVAYYDATTRDSTSRLKSVQEFGSNLRFASDGTTIRDDLSGETLSSLPVTTFSYNNASSFGSGVEVTALTGRPFHLAKWSTEAPYYDVWADTIAAVDVNSDGVTEILRKTFAESNSTGCTYTLFHNPQRDTAYTAKTLTALPCKPGPLVNNAATTADLVSGHFSATNKKETQLLLLAPNSDEKLQVKTIATLKKAASDFTLTVNDCDSTSGLDSVLVLRCEKIYPQVMPYDPEGDGLDVLAKFESGRGNFFGDGRDQQLTIEVQRNYIRYLDKAGTGSLDIGDLDCKQNCLYADLNGDGLDDFIRVSNGANLKPFLFTGDRLIEWLPGFSVGGSSNYSTFVSDSDGDGKAEIGIGGGAGGAAGNKTWKVFRFLNGPTGKSYSKTPLEKSDGTALVSSSIKSGDFNGDGQTDLLIAPENGTGNSAPLFRNANGTVTGSERSYYEWFDNRKYKIHYGTLGRAANAMKTITTSLGGKVEVSYKPSTLYNHTYLPFSMPTVSDFTVSDGRGGSETTTYTYANGDFDVEKRRFLGFGTVTKTLPAIGAEGAGPVVRTTFSQTLATIGMPSKTEYLDTAGTVRRKVTETYALKLTTLPYRAQNTVTETDITSGSLTRNLKTERTFDGYGNLLQKKDLGRTDDLAVGDETLLTAEYKAPDASAYIVSLPQEIALYKGSTPSTSGLRSLQERQYYATGKLKKQIDYLVKDGAYQTKTYVYDIWGNVTSATNGEGETTLYEYDSVHHEFVTKTISPSETAVAEDGLTKTATYNAACGAPASETDYNGTVTRYKYDDFCRPTEIRNMSSQSYTSTSYLDIGGADQRIKTSTSLPTGTETADVYDYFDGLGRTWWNVTIGDGTSPTARIDTKYDKRGNISQVSLPYVTGQTPAYTTTLYDWANRPVNITNPDATSKAIAYGLQADNAQGNPFISVSGDVPLEFTRVEDETKALHYTYTSTSGDVIAKYQKFSLTNSTARWLYGATFDGAHRMIATKDAGGSQWSYSYDMVGNRKTANDPDLGTWSYTYDKANRLIKQTDARDCVTTITYDRNGRKLRTTGYTSTANVTSGTDPVLLSSNIYDEAKSGYYNKGQLTTSYNDLSRQEFNYNRDGLEAQKTVKLTEAANTATGFPGIDLVHVEETRYNAGRQPLSKYYYQLNPATLAKTKTLSVGSSSDPWIYNRKGQLISIPDYIDATTYELDGQTTSITYKNGVKTTFTYDPARRWLIGIKTVKDPGNGQPVTNILNEVYERFDTGRIKKVDADGLSTNYDWTYTYDGFGRILTTVLQNNANYSETFTYTSNDNLISRTRFDGGSFTYPSATVARPHAPLSLNGLDFTYDDNGNTRTIGKNTTDTADDREYAYDRANRLKSVVIGTGSPTTYRYGPDGARAKMSSSGGTTYYIDADVEYDLANARFTRYPHMDVKVDADKWFLHRDHLSSVRVVTNDDGVIDEATRYVVYGEPSNKGMKTQKSYIGERYEDKAGLLYLNARYMDPKFGRFIPADEGASQPAFEKAASMSERQ